MFKVKYIVLILNPRPCICTC